MSDQPTSREALYARIRRSSLETVVWEEMVRLGYWPRDGAAPGDLASEMTRRAELHAEIARLRKAETRLNDEEKILAIIRKERMAQARATRAETKAKREADKLAKAAAWKASQASEIIYLGDGFSGGLSDSASNGAALREAGLPVLDTAADIAGAMGIELGRLRWLSYARAASDTSHWVRFQVPKKAGGMRHISAPRPHLKAAQSWILNTLLYKLDVHPAAHGFVPGRSIVTNAQPHVGKTVVVNLDLKDFFPTVTYPRVWGLFRSFGYSQQVATVLALLCTEPPIEVADVDGKRWYVACGQRVLPQGAPTSPAITNLLCRGLDRRLTTLATAMGFVFTRYADDLTFSSDSAEGATSESVGKLLRRVRHLVKQQGFVVHPNKTRVLRRGRRQEVTGITVNDQLGVERAHLRRFRAVLHQIERDGPEGKRWGAEGTSVLASIAGYANYVWMVDPAKGGPLKARVAAIVARFAKATAPAAPAAVSVASPSAAVPSPTIAAQAPTPATTTAPEAVPPAEPAAPAEPGDAKPDEAKPGEEDEWWKLW